VPPIYAQQFMDLIPDAEAEMIEDAGHVPQVEQRELVSSHVIRFLG
jgi:pimeloyl-ACP methyl ester carboxylesterase